jgi:hypothetical protein
VVMGDQPSLEVMADDELFGRWFRGPSWLPEKPSSQVLRAFGDNGDLSSFVSAALVPDKPASWGRLGRAPSSLLITVVARLSGALPRQGARHFCVSRSASATPTVFPGLRLEERGCAPPRS